MLKYESPKRSIPITTQSQDLFMLQQAKMRVERNYLDDIDGINNRDSRYNVKLTDTIDQDRVNKNVDIACNRQKYVPPKAANKSAHPDNNIAIYDLHAADINNTHILGNLLPEKFRHDAQRKIQTPNSWVKDYDYIATKYEQSGLPEIYTQGPTINTFPLNKEAFNNKFDELTKESFGNNPNLHSETINNIDTFGYNIDNTTNGTLNGYLDSLQPSSTNLPKQAFEDYGADQGLPNAAKFPDERLQQNLQTYHRQYRDENSRVISGWNLHKSDYIKERNARQREADIALQHNGMLKLPQIKTQDYIQFLDEQTHGGYQPIFNEKDFTDGLASKYNERNSGGFKLSSKPPKQPTANTRRIASVDETTKYDDAAQAGWGTFHSSQTSNAASGKRHGNISSKNVIDDIQQRQSRDNVENFYKYEQAVDKNISLRANNNLRNHQDVNESVNNIIENYEQSQQMRNIVDEQQRTIHVNPMEEVRHRDVQYRLDNSVKQGEFYNEYTRQNNGLSTYANDKQQQLQRREDFGEFTGRNQIGDSNYPIINLIRGQGIVQKEAFPNKSSHILITKTGKVENVYWDPNIDEVAQVLITCDGQNRPIRTFATLSKGYITIIQKRDPTYLDIANGEYYKDDFITLTIPVESLPNHLRKHITEASKRRQTTSNRKNANKILEMSFDDLIELSQVLIDEKDKTRRLKIDTLKSYFHENKFNEQLLYGYADKIFTTPWVVEHVERSERMALDDRNNVVQKNYYDVDNGQDSIPQPSNAMSQANRSLITDEKAIAVNIKNEQFANRDMYFDDFFMDNQ